MEKIVSSLAAFVVAMISSGGYLSVLLLMAIESACIPLPSEVIMPFAGYLVYQGRFHLLWVATAGALGCNLGSAVAYAVGYYGGRPLVQRWGRYIFLNQRDLEISERFFQKYGDATVFFSRLLPVVRTFIALPAGIGKMRQARFHLYTFIGSWPWCYGLAFVGMKLGEKWNSDPRLKQLFHRFDAVMVAALLIGAAWFLYAHWRHRMRSATP